MKPRRTLLVVLAHPDDEVLMGGTLAHYAAAGARVVLVTASRGEAGTIFNPSLATPANIAQVREEELHCSCQTLGIEPPIFLGCGDGAVRECSEAALSEVVGLMRSLQPDAVLTFGPDGMYGHPDHVAAYRLATQAWEMAGNPELFPDQVAAGKRAYQPRRLYYYAMLQSWIDAWSQYADLSVDLNGEKLRIAGVPDDTVDVRIDVESWVDTKERAMACHGTQLNPDSPMRTMPEEEWRRFRSSEHFVLGRGVALPASPASDLFAGM